MKKQACGTYLIRDDKILFLVRHKEKDTVHPQGIYLPIGGKVELGESVEVCAKREVKEESGMMVHTVKLAGIIYVKGQGTGEKDWINFIFISSDFEGTPVKGNEGTFEWVPINKLDSINLYKGDIIYLRYILKNQFFVIEYEYKGFEYIKHIALYPLP